MSFFLYLQVSCLEHQLCLSTSWPALSATSLLVVAGPSPKLSVSSFWGVFPSLVSLIPSLHAGLFKIWSSFEFSSFLELPWGFLPYTVRIWWMSQQNHIFNCLFEFSMLGWTSVVSQSAILTPLHHVRDLEKWPRGNPQGDGEVSGRLLSWSKGGSYSGGPGGKQKGMKRRGCRYTMTRSKAGLQR